METSRTQSFVSRYEQNQSDNRQTEGKEKGQDEKSKCNYACDLHSEKTNEFDKKD